MSPERISISDGVSSRLVISAEMLITSHWRDGCEAPRGLVVGAAEVSDCCIDHYACSDKKPLESPLFVEDRQKIPATAPVIATDDMI